MVLNILASIPKRKMLQGRPVNHTLTRSTCPRTRCTVLYILAVYPYALDVTSYGSESHPDLIRARYVVYGVPYIELVPPASCVVVQLH